MISVCCILFQSIVDYTKFEKMRCFCCCCDHHHLSKQKHAMIKCHQTQNPNVINAFISRSGDLVLAIDSMCLWAQMAWYGSTSYHKTMLKIVFIHLCDSFSHAHRVSAQCIRADLKFDKRRKKYSKNKLRRKRKTSLFVRFC